MLTRRSLICSALYFWGIFPGEDKPTITVSPASAYTGQKVTVSWSAPHAASAYLVGFGRVSSAGEKEFTAKSNAVFQLIVDTPDGPNIRAAVLKIIGQEGGEEDFEADTGLYRYPYPAKLKPYQDYGALIDGVWNVITSQLKAIPRGTFTDLAAYKFQTSRIQPPDLQVNLPPVYAGRRISYLIEGPGPKTFQAGAPIPITIRSFIQFRRRVEPNWQPENDPKLYQESAAKLAELLG